MRRHRYSPSNEHHDHAKLLAITEQNRRAWNEIADVRHRTQPRAAFFAEGGNVLESWVIGAAGDVRDLSVLHLQCSTGEETLSWANLGAATIGVDISDRQIEIARSTAESAGLSGATFVAADVMQLDLSFDGNAFDIVYAGKGVLMWLPSLTQWARLIAKVLRPGGRCIVFEIHPFSGIFRTAAGSLTIARDYFGRNTPRHSDASWGHFPNAGAFHEGKVLFDWPLSDLINALIAAGLVIDQLDEMPLDETVARLKGVDHAERLPGFFGLVARAP